MQGFIWRGRALTHWFLFPLGLCLLPDSLSAADQWAPFVIPARPHPDSLIAAASGPPIQTTSSRLIARDSRFVRDEVRVKIWGVNLSFGANFPTHEDASTIAARLAAAGVNSVRCHHMDTASWPRGIWDRDHPTRLSADALDRLDFFIDQLASHGILVNLNLHVGREHSKFIGLPKVNRQYDKITCLFTPPIIAAQKNFARQLLHHFNTYRRIKYADDPAVAVIEITNENSFFMWDSEKTLRSLPDYYAALLQDQYNTWLKRHYTSDQALARAWNEGISPPGDNLLHNGDFQADPLPGGSIPQWSLEQHQDCRATVHYVSHLSRNALRLGIEAIDDTEWHLQFKQEGLSLQAGQFYTISFAAASDQPRSLGCGVSMALSPWNNLGLSQTADLALDWREFTFGFVAGQTEDKARLTFSLGSSTAPVYLANVQLHPGGRVGLAKDESMRNASIKLYGANESPLRIESRMRFLAETEKEYFDGMRNFIRNDLGSGALVTGTIVFGPLGLYAQSDMDFIDAHAYWQHPRFPGRPWDSGNWLIDQKPMADHPAEATLFGLAAQRLQGKPFTVSEYNHPAPMDSQAECVPMIAAFGAAQDWDGIWLYTYSHASDDWQRQHLNQFFDIDSNPAKWGFMRAGTAIFRDGATQPLAGQRVAPLSHLSETWPDLIKLHLQHGRDMFRAVSAADGITREDLLQASLCIALRDSAPDSRAEITPSRISWTLADDQGCFMVSGGAGILAGHSDMFDKESEGYAVVNSPGYAVITATPLDQKPWTESRRILITACGRCENTGMTFSKNRATVGRQWGEAPVRIETVEGILMIPTGVWQGQALGPDGLAKAPVPLRREGTKTFLDLSPRYQTMWYLLTRP